MKTYLELWTPAAVLSVIFIAVFTLSPHAAAEWKQFGSDKYHSYEYDTDSITWPDDDTARVWTKDMVKDAEGVEYITQERKKREIQVEGYSKYLYTVHYVEFQCSSRQNRLLAMYDYNSDGMVLYSEEFPHSDWTSIVPSTQANQLYKIVCSAPQQ